MNSFRDGLHDDINRVFLNLDEFADEVTVANRPCKGIVDGPHIGQSDMTDGRPGVAIETMSIVIASGLIALPVVHRTINVNGQTWTVAASSEQDGMMSVDIWRERT